MDLANLIRFYFYCTRLESRALTTPLPFRLLTVGWPALESRGLQRAARVDAELWPLGSGATEAEPLAGNIGAPLVFACISAAAQNQY